MTTTTTQSMAPGVHYRVPRAVYDALPYANQSRLKVMVRETPAHAQFDALFPQEETDALLLGLAWHDLLLGGEDLFQANYTVWRGGRRASKEWDAFETAAGEANLKVLTIDQEQTARRMVASFLEHSEAARLFSRGAEAEAVLIWKEPELGITCKARLDQFIEDAEGWSTIADAKGISSIAPGNIERTIVNFGYDFQAAFYLRGAAALGYQRCNFLLVPVETGGNAAYPKPTIVNDAGEPRNAVRVLEFDERTINRGKVMVEAALALYQSCAVSGRWPSYPVEIERVSAPEWALREVER